MEALSIFLGECSVVVIFQERVDARQKLLSQLLNFAPNSWYINSVSLQFLPNYFKAPFRPFTEHFGSALEIGVIFIETVVGEMNVRVAEILLGRLLVVLNAKSSQPFLIEVANIGTN